MKPPQHRIDAPAIYVLIDDPAWDHDRINEELKGMPEGDHGEHPYIAYHAGATRYDLGARITWSGGEASAADYLKDGAVRFELRRLPPEQYAEVQDAYAREYRREGENASYNAVWLKAARYSIASIDGSSSIRFPRGARMSDDVMYQIMDDHGGMPTITRIGLAAWTLSQPITAAEGKR